jgi:hypothetical protein
MSIPVLTQQANPQANPTPILPENIMTPDELANRLKLKKSWLYEQSRRRSDIRNSDVLPCFRLGLYLRYDWAAVEKWLQRQKVPKCTK